MRGELRAGGLPEERALPRSVCPPAWSRFTPCLLQATRLMSPDREPGGEAHDTEKTDVGRQLKDCAPW